MNVEKMLCGYVYGFSFLAASEGGANVFEVSYFKSEFA